jgi:hypothetical protein
MRYLILIVIFLELLSTEDKIALLIGNSDYDFAPLSNPLNDVDGIYKTLDEINFDDIKVLKNASKTEMENALLNFEEKAQSAEIALIYFSGHGMQVNNINYMFPARTKVTKPIHLKKLVDLEMFIQSATSAKYGIILVDACRDNPLVKYFQNGRYKGSNAKKGLGQVTPKSGQVVIGFATSAGETANDGNGDMSPYAMALSKRLKTPNKDITKVLGLVALDVSAKYNQNPIYRANLAYDVILNKDNFTKRNQMNKYDRIPKKVKARHILLHSKKDAEDIIDLLLKSQNLKSKFIKLAKEKSTGPSSKYGGDLGWFTKDRMVPEFSQVVWKLEKNTINKIPVKTAFGYHVIYLEDKMF